MKKYKYVILKQRRDNFGMPNGYTRSTTKTIRANSRDEAKAELMATLRGRPFKMLGVKK